MRLRQIKQLLYLAVPHTNVAITERNSNPRTYILRSSSDLKKAIELLSKTELFNDHIERLKSFSFYKVGTENPIIQDAEFKALTKEVTQLNELIMGLINSLEKIIPTEDPNILSIKIPNPTSFKDITVTTESLDKIFSQTLLHKDIGGGFHIVNFDTGSYWIDIMINGGAQVMHFVAALSWGGAVVYKKLQEGRLISEQVRQLKISNDALKEVNDKTKEGHNEVALEEAEYIYRKFYKGNDPEQIQRIKFALNELAEMFSKGTEIYPSLEAPKEVKMEFPNMKSIENIKSKIKNLPPNK